MQEANSNLPDAVNEDLGDFSPPADFNHGAEFVVPVPRPVPSFLRKGSYAARRRNTLFSLFVAAVVCFILASMSFVQELSYYILLLGYLDLLGLGLLFILAIIVFIRCFDPGLYRYVKEGEPIVGRILKADKTVNDVSVAEELGHPVISVQYDIAVEYLDPDSGHMKQIENGLENKWDIPINKKTTFEFSAGDYVTLVGFPGSLFQSSLRIYGLLGLDPNRELLLINGRPPRGLTIYAILLIAFSIIAGMLLLLAALYAVEFYWPISGNWQVGIIPGVIGAVLGLIGGWWLLKFEEMPLGVLDQVLLMLGAVGFGVFCGLEVLFIGNAFFDDSKSNYQPVHVVGFWQETNALIFQNYDIEYRELKGGESQKIASTVATMSRFTEDLGVVEIGEGYFGFRWRRGIHPLVWTQKRVPEIDESRHIYISDTKPDVANQKMFLVYTPMIELRGGLLVIPPEKLIQIAMEREAQPEEWIQD